MSESGFHKKLKKLFRSNRKSRLKFVHIFLVFIQISELVGDESFCYNDAICGPANWEGDCQTGVMQSPINIPVKKVTNKSGSARITLNRNYAKPKLFFVKNTGHTLQVLINSDEKSKCYLKGAGLGPDAYYFSQLHFHWGPNNLLGSEHQISGKAYPLEMHMVHRGLKDDDLITVLSILFYLSPNDNKNLIPIFNLAGKVLQPGDIAKTTETNKLTLSSLLPKKLRMFRYTGSRTTPPCTENVSWTVFRDPLPVSKNQMAKLRKINTYDDKPILLNYRPLQPAFTSVRKRVFFIRQLKTNEQGVYWGQGQQQQGQFYYEQQGPYHNRHSSYEDYYWDWHWHHQNNQHYYYDADLSGPGPVPPSDAEFEWIDLASVAGK